MLQQRPMDWTHRLSIEHGAQGHQLSAYCTARREWRHANLNVAFCQPGTRTNQTQREIVERAVEGHCALWEL